MRKKLLRQLEARFGTPPDYEYFAEDLEGLRTYWEYDRGRNPDAFCVDDTTWRDLSMDAVYQRMNATLTTSGEQYLYYLLRTPARDAAELARRRRLIDWMEANPDARLAAQEVLARLGKRRAANTSATFVPERSKPWLLLLTVVLMLSMFGAIVCAFVLRQALPVIVMAIVNIGFHMYMLHRMEGLATVQYSAGMVRACLRLCKRMPRALLDMLPGFERAGRRCRWVARLGGVQEPVVGEMATYFNMFFHSDVLSYELTRLLRDRRRADIFAIHEMLGMLDAAIAVASWRAGAAFWCAPEIDFAPDAPPLLDAEDMAHPLLADPVPNSLRLDTPLLVTGSNASGKSTFLKAVAVNALLAQGVCTALCMRYAATSFHVYSSMAIADNILAGDSYFIAEIKSIRRIVRAAEAGNARILCVIDEVLRGTNTVERIAASCELLEALRAQNVLCAAATHDGELCELLGAWRQAHFTEVLAAGDVRFDFLLRDGPATSRNAIALLGVLGFPEALVARAQRRAEGYLRDGRWR